MVFDSIDKVFFYCATSATVETASFQHLAICLGEGLRELGIEVFSNVNYWIDSDSSDDFIFKNDPKVTPDDCPVVVVSEDWLHSGNPFPQHLFCKPRKYLTVYLDRSDGSKTYSWQPDFRQFDIILKTHYSKNFFYPKNFYPWAFGISQRIINSLNNPLPFSRRKAQILVNFRDKHFIHSVRKSVYRELLPKIESVLSVDRSVDSYDNPPVGTDEYLLWVQTGGRHNSNYYSRLEENFACACFGGYFESPFPRDKAKLVCRFQKRILSELGWKTRYISQWDSWRFWESLTAGCVTFQVDLNKYSLQLPIMPENWKHYIGVDLENVQETIDRIKNSPEALDSIASAGRQWALEYYGPKPTALRFLQIVSEIQ